MVIYVHRGAVFQVFTGSFSLCPFVHWYTLILTANFSVRLCWSLCNFKFFSYDWFLLFFHMDLFFFIAANFQLFFFLKIKFWDNSHNFHYFGKKIRSRRHFPHLPKLTNLFSNNMSKFRANNHFSFAIIFYSQVKKKKMISDTFTMKNIDFLNCKMPKE